jgi:UDP:flavonoid glycosyltransferase YjiC (YdhE family)
VLVAAMPFAGHVAPMAAVAAELARRGSEVVPRTGTKFRPRFTDGCWGGVLAALGAGVPLVVAGGTLDKPEVARRVA